MPLFEYVCQSCGHRFEALVNRSSTPACPSCESQELSRQLSVFAVGSASGPGACKLN